MRVHHILVSVCVSRRGATVENVEMGIRTDRVEAGKRKPPDRSQSVTCVFYYCDRIEICEIAFRVRVLFQSSVLMVHIEYIRLIN